MKGYFTLSATEDPRTWQLPVDPWRSVGGRRGFLFGGVGLGAVIAAVERSLDRATIWATSQYLDFAPLGSTVDIRVSPLVEGRYTTQARAAARIGEREILGVALSLGARPSGPHQQWAYAEPVPVPERCPTLPMDWETVAGDLYSLLEIRVARGWDAPATDGTAGDGRIMLWVRPTSGEPVDRPMLALMGDFVPASMGNVLAAGEGHVYVNSLDNCMRFLTLVPTTWVLCDVSLHGTADGFGHGRMHLFAEDGTLMATASQSVVVRGRALPVRFGERH